MVALGLAARKPTRWSIAYCDIVSCINTALKVLDFSSTMSGKLKSLTAVHSFLVVKSPIYGNIGFILTTTHVW
jgi:hypothetical protein